MLIATAGQPSYDTAMAHSSLHPHASTTSHHANIVAANAPAVHVGELYGKPDAHGQIRTLYHVLALHKAGITLQNMDNPLSQFDTTAEKLWQSGYVRLSQTPYVNIHVQPASRGKAKAVQAHKAKRCPYTLDIFAERADSERPQWPPSHDGEQPTPSPA